MIRSLPAVALISALVTVSSEPGKNTPSFTYSQSYSLHLTADEGYQDAYYHEQNFQPLVVASSLLYEQGCEMSAHAFMHDHTSLLGKLFEKDSEESDDDDDEDDDGHSSMLSNASLNSKFSTNNKVEQASMDAVTILRGGAADAASLSGEVLKRLLTAALVTLVFEGLIGHILEFLKIVMQTTPDMTYLQVIGNITREKGILGLWDGFVPWGVVQAVFKGAVFGLAHSAALKMLVPVAKDGIIPMALAYTLAGGIGGGFQGFVLSPTLLLKTRVMTNPVFREKMSMLRTTWLSFCIGFDVVQKEGFAALMKGADIFATKRVFDWASRYFFANLFEDTWRAFKGDALNLWEQSAASFVGGIASTCVTLPLDVLVAKTQDAKKAGVNVSPLELFRNELKEKGLGGLKDSYMRGFEARLLHVCLTTVVIKTGAPVVYDVLFGKKV